MNVKTMFKTLAVAVPMAFSSGNMAAQSTKILKSAERIVRPDSTVVVKDTLKALDAKAADAKVILMKKYNGHFNGSVKGGKIADGTLDYVESGKTALAAAAPRTRLAKPRTKISLSTAFVASEKAPSVGLSVRGSVESRRNIWDVGTLYASKDKVSFLSTNAYYTRLFPVAKNWAVTAKAGADCTVRRSLVTDHYGMFTPSVEVGARYKRNFSKNGWFSAKAEGGVGVKTMFRDHTPGVEPDRNKPKFVGNAAIEVGGKHFSGFAQGGVNPVLGPNAGAGLKYTF